MKTSKTINSNIKKIGFFKRIKKRKKVETLKAQGEYNLNVFFDYDSFLSILASTITRLVTSTLFTSFASFFISYLFPKSNIFHCLVLIAIIIILPLVCLLLNKLQKRHFINRKDGSIFRLTADQLLQIRDSLPFHLFDPEIESVNWLNEIIKRVWSKIQIHLNQKIHAQQYLQLLFGQKWVNLLQLSLTNTLIGNQVPFISGINVKRRGLNLEDVIIDFDIIFNSDLNFLIKGKYSIKAGIERFFIRSRLRIILSPLFHEQPSIGKIYIMLASTPQLDWTFNGAFEPLNLNIFKSIASKCLFFWLGVPSKVSINIAKQIPSRESKLKEPKGLVQIDINEASNLPRSKSFCPSRNVNAYCVVSVEKIEKWTQVMKNTSCPEWNASFFFLVNQNDNNLIRFAVFDEESDNKKEKDRLIGTFSASIDTFAITNPEINGRELTASLWDHQTGLPINKDVTKISFRVSWFRLSNNKAKIKTCQKSSRNKLPVAVLSVLIESVTGLETTAKQIQIPELRSLVRISVGNSTQVTSAKERTGYPVWDQALHFLLFNFKLETINIEVVDMYNVFEKRLLLFLKTKRKKKRQDWVKLSQDGVVLGYLKVPVLKVFEAFEMKLQGNYRLEGFLKKAYIKLLLVIRLTEYSNDVEDNSNKPRTVFPIFH